MPYISNLLQFNLNSHIVGVVDGVAVYPVSHWHLVGFDLVLQVA